MAFFPKYHFPLTMNLRSNLPLLMAAMAANNLHGAVLANWDFSNLDWSTGGGSGLALNDPAPSPILEAALANTAPGVTSTDLLPSPNLHIVVNATTAPGEADVRDFDYGGDGGNDNYLEFTLTGSAPGSLSIETISISQWRNGGGAVDGMAFEVSVDGGAFSLYDSIQVDPNSGNGPSFDTFTFTETISGAESVAIRFAPRHVNQGSTGNLHINGLTVTGTAIPEPSSLILSGLAAFGLLLKRSR